MDHATRGSGNLERSGAEKQGSSGGSSDDVHSGIFFLRRVELWGQVNGWI